MERDLLVEIETASSVVFRKYVVRKWSPSRGFAYFEELRAGKTRSGLDISSDVIIYECRKDREETWSRLKMRAT